MTAYGLPNRQGLYRPENEKENCGVGFVADIRGNATNRIVKQGLDILKNMKHRGAIGADGSTGDGSGILLQIPHHFFNEVMEGVLPQPGDYAVGMFFLPMEPNARLYCEGVVERVVREEGLKLIGWRMVPVDEKAIGDLAKATRPVISQIFIEKNLESKKVFENTLLIIRKRVAKIIRESKNQNVHMFYACSLSPKVIIYKGLVLGYRLDEFYHDLKDEKMTSAIVIVHERYSTNSFPAWELAQPFRGIAHNGEINTIRGNINWMNAREGVLKSKTFGEDFSKIFPIIEPGGSDSASLDNALELLVSNGHSIEQSMMMLIPEPWQNDKEMNPELRSFYEYTARFLEPWDGPATVVFTDGNKVGVILDRNGLRPARYLITKDHMVVMASETGVLQIPEDEIVVKKLVKPREILLIDTEKGLIVPDEMIKQVVAAQEPFCEWIKRNRITLSEIKDTYEVKKMRTESFNKKKNIFGYTEEELSLVIGPMIKDGKEAIGSMGNAIPIAPLSKRPQLLFNYFKQNFAQVTNPPIDPIRERNIMSLIQFAGPRGYLLDEMETNQNLPYLKLDNPILSNKRIEDIRHLSGDDFRTTTIPITFIIDQKRGLEKALEHLCRRAEESVLDGNNIIILSDRSLGRYHAAIPSLIAVSAVHHHLIDIKMRTSVDLIVETGDARDVMHIALLIGYGAKAVNPYMVYDHVTELVADESNSDVMSMDQGFSNYCKAISDGLYKVLSRMGISTLQSYSGAQRFQALGINSSVVDQYFNGTPTSIEGIGLEGIAEEVIVRHLKAYELNGKEQELLDKGGEIYYKASGENHILDPAIVKLLAKASRNNDYNAYSDYSELIFRDINRIDTIRGLLSLKQKYSISIDEVQSTESIMKKFFIGGMSFGSLSKPVHESIAIAMNKIGAMSNSGEGGEDEARYSLCENGDNMRSAIKQVSSARFGVTTEYLVNCDEIEIKMAQGAKPGEGGHLPGKKVTAEIARIRHSIPGIDLVSPPPHHDIYSIEDLAQLIFDLKNVNPNARVGVKLVAENGVGTVAAGISKAHADFVTICGHDGGTGASPVSSMKYVGLPWEIGLAEAQQTLLLNSLRGRITLQVDGKLRTGKDIVIAAILGAEKFGFATTALITQGCIMCRRCHQNRCPVGIATQEKSLIEKFDGKPEYLINYLTMVAQEVREILSSLGFKNLTDIIGRMDLLCVNQTDHEKINGLDLSALLYQPELPERIAKKCVTVLNHKLDDVLDHNLIACAKDALEGKNSISEIFRIRNTDRAVGAMLSGMIAKRFGSKGLDDGMINFEFIGSAGQSFGAFAIKGLTLKLIGDANDYVAKGLSGATIIVQPSPKATYRAHENVIAGNTLLYGATSGELYINGTVGQRFAVRNSGAIAVAEGIGDHGCEYMTGGTVMILGHVGNNFGAGMSGGTAYVYDKENILEKRCNEQNAKVMDLDEHDLEKIKQLLERHYSLTNSELAESLLEEFDKVTGDFKKVVSPQYLELTRLN
jgi:glutamate synthase (NADPH/NADH) large chain